MRAEGEGHCALQRLLRVRILPCLNTRMHCIALNVSAVSTASHALLASITRYINRYCQLERAGWSCALCGQYNEHLTPQEAK